MHARWLTRAMGLGIGGLLGACASSGAGVGAASGPVAAQAGGPPLPPGQGREILESQCLRCHELDALTLFRDFYGQTQWRALITTMRANGAELDDAQVEVLARYLAEHFGTGGG